jgi:hypothetical protein
LRREPDKSWLGSLRANLTVSSRRHTWRGDVDIRASAGVLEWAGRYAMCADAWYAICDVPTAEALQYNLIAGPLCCWLLP